MGKVICLTLLTDYCRYLNQQTNLNESWIAMPTKYEDITNVLEIKSNVLVKVTGFFDNTEYDIQGFRMDSNILKNIPIGNNKKLGEYASDFLIVPLSKADYVLEHNLVDGYDGSNVTTSWFVNQLFVEGTIFLYDTDTKKISTV